MVKTDSDGNMLWNKTYGETGSDSGVPVLETVKGGYAIIGFTRSFGAGDQDWYVVKTDELGVVPEGLTSSVMLLLSTAAATVGIGILRKHQN